MAEIYNKLKINAKLSTSTTSTGCSNLEINVLKRSQCVEYLPTMYIEYLSKLGRHNGKYLRDWRSTYEWVLTAKQEAIFQSFGKFNMEQNIFVFASANQNHGTFLYFRTDKRLGNPSIFIYSEKEGNRIYYETLSEFYLDELEKLGIKLDK